jgi:RNA polymerase primary sigma factor
MKQLTITTRLTNRDDESFVRYLREISEIKVLTPKEETELTKKASEGDKEAIDELVKRNLRFVVSVAKQYATPQNPVVDLVNEGNIGLIIAAQKFDPTSGYKFISYALGLPERW